MNVLFYLHNHGYYSDIYDMQQMSDTIAKNEIYHTC